MARRIIRTVDGQTFSDSCRRFEDRKGYILYKVGAFNTLRINKRNVTTDDVRGLPASVVMVGVFALVVIIMIAFLSFNRTTENAKVQSNVNIATDASPIVIASTNSGLYYLPECPGYNLVESHHKRIFDSEQHALDAGFTKSENCP